MLPAHLNTWIFIKFWAGIRYRNCSSCRGNSEWHINTELIVNGEERASSSNVPIGSHAYPIGRSLIIKQQMMLCGSFGETIGTRFFNAYRKIWIFKHRVTFHTSVLVSFPTLSACPLHFVLTIVAESIESRLCHSLDPNSRALYK